MEHTSQKYINENSDKYCKNNISFTTSSGNFVTFLQTCQGREENQIYTRIKRLVSVKVDPRFSYKFGSILLESITRLRNTMFLIP